MPEAIVAQGVEQNHPGGSAAHHQIFPEEFEALYRCQRRLLRNIFTMIGPKGPYQYSLLSFFEIILFQKIICKGTSCHNFPAACILVILSVIWKTISRCVTRTLLVLEKNYYKLIRTHLHRALEITGAMRLTSFLKIYQSRCNLESLTIIRRAVYCFCNPAFLNKSQPYLNQSSLQLYPSNLPALNFAKIVSKHHSNHQRTCSFVS